MTAQVAIAAMALLNAIPFPSSDDGGDMPSVLPLDSDGVPIPYPSMPLVATGGRNAHAAERVPCPVSVWFVYDCERWVSCKRC